MSDTSTQTQLMHGGEFLIKESHAANTFIPEDFNDEQRMMANAAHQFIETEVQPVVDRLEKLEDGLTVSLLEKSGELGLLGASIPAAFATSLASLTAAFESNTTSDVLDLRIFLISLGNLLIFLLILDLIFLTRQKILKRLSLF